MRRVTVRGDMAESSVLMTRTRSKLQRASSDGDYLYTGGGDLRDRRYSRGGRVRRDRRAGAHLLRQRRRTGGRRHPPATRTFGQAHPSITVALRATPDAADQRHQLYVQWLNARASDPDVLQLDVVWTPEFAAAGWIASLDRFDPPVDRFLPAAVAADRWNGALYALPWFVDVGMLYWRTDLVPRPPRDLDDLVAACEACPGRARRPVRLRLAGGPL